MKLMEKIFTSPIDLLKKAEKDKERLEESLLIWDEVTIRESLFNFTVSCYHLVDWIKVYCPKLESKVYELLNNNKYIGACRDLCNASKHVKLDLERGPYVKYPPVVSDVEQSATGSMIASQLPNYRLKIQFEDGERLAAEEVIENAMKAWKRFFDENGIGKNA